MESIVTLETFDHDGVVVKDAEATAESWSSKLGAGPWRFTDAGILKLAHGKIGTITYELLQPLEDTSLWAKFLAENGEGLHHICHTVPDVDEAAAKLEEAGGTILITTPKVFAYVDIGGPGSVILELLKTRKKD